MQCKTDCWGIWTYTTSKADIFPGIAWYDFIINLTSCDLNLTWWISVSLVFKCWSCYFHATFFFSLRIFHMIDFTCIFMHHLLLNVGNVTKESGPVSMTFTIPMYNSSKLQVRHCPDFGSCVLKIITNPMKKHGIEMDKALSLNPLLLNANLFGSITVQVMVEN